MNETEGSFRNERSPSRNPEATVVHLTPGGFRRLQARITAARLEYFAACAETEAAAESGDSSVWHDNFAFEENARQKHQLARRVKDLEAMAASARVHELPRTVPTAVRLGTVVTLLYEDGAERTWFLAGWDDGNPEAGRVAYNSALGRALVGKEEGDEVRWGPGDNAHRAEVVAIRAATAEMDEG